MNIRTAASIVPGACNRPFARRPAISHSVMEATAIPPEDLALRIALFARAESREGSTESQIRT